MKTKKRELEYFKRVLKYVQKLPADVFQYQPWRYIYINYNCDRIEYTDQTWRSDGVQPYFISLNRLERTPKKYIIENIKEDIKLLKNELLQTI